jgi:hypothetical protein
MYGVPTNKSENTQTPATTSGRTNFAEVIALKDVSFWCDVSAMKEFHQALERSLSMTLDRYGYSGMGQVMSLSDPKKTEFFTSREEILVKLRNKHPFAYVEGTQVPYLNGDFEASLTENELDINAPTGLASFNPRNPNFQPPGFTFSPIARKESDIIPVNKQKFLIGAKFALLGNSVATPFPPVYVWDPCVCDQSQVWDAKSKTMKRNSPVFIKTGSGNLYTNTWSLYKEILANNPPPGFPFETINTYSALSQSEKMRKTVSQKTDSGESTGYVGPMRQFIQAGKHQVSSQYKNRFKSKR